MKKTVSFSKNSTNVFFHILTACNLKCRHCYINPEQHGKERLPLPTIESWLTAFARRGPTANVIFLGGEPTLHPDLPAAVRIARELGYRSITVDTNGYLFHDFIDHVGPDELDYLSFSLDGATRTTNDRIRGEGSYDQCLRGIRAAVSRGFKTSLIYTVSNENYHELKMMGPLLQSLGIRRFFIQVIGLRGKSAEAGGASCHSDLQVPAARWMENVPKVAAAIAELGITVTYPKVFLSSREGFECAGRVADNYFIFPNGRVYQCPLCEDFPIHSQAFEGDVLVSLPPINEGDLFRLTIPEGCVMNKLIQPANIQYGSDGEPLFKIACCLLKEEIIPS